MDVYTPCPKKGSHQTFANNFGGKYYAVLLEIFILYPAVKEF